MLRNFILIMILLSFGLLFAACSGEESITEKASKQVDEVTTKAADKAVKKIRAPINKANLTKNLGDDRMQAMDKALQKQ